MNPGACVAAPRWTAARTVSAVIVGLLVHIGPARAQTTVVLDMPQQHVEDIMIQNGRHADTNFFGDLLMTRASDAPDLERRSVLAFDTEQTVPPHSTIVSASLTLTVHSGAGGGGSRRKVSAYRVTQPFDAMTATWRHRAAGMAWLEPGGDLAEEYGPVNVPARAGEQVHFDLTALVQRAVDGALDSRWTRIALVDVDFPNRNPAANNSHREYFSSATGSAATRPRLTVVYEPPVLPPPVEEPPAEEPPAEEDPPADEIPPPNPGLPETTIVLDLPGGQVGDTMIQNGRHADTNSYGGLLLTRASTDPDWERRSLLQFDTEGTIPLGSPIASATLVLTVRTGLGTAGSTRRVGAFRVSEPFAAHQATWRSRQTGTEWAIAGGSLSEGYFVADVTNVAGTPVSFDLSGLVQRTVDGEFGSRVTRVGLVDIDTPTVDPDAKVSYREYFSSSATDPAVRPRLVVVFRGEANQPSDQTQVIDVPAGGDLQAALNVVAPGGVVRLAAGATYAGNFVLPAKGGTDYVTITTDGVTLPPAGTRIDRALRPALATLRSGNTQPALATAPGASYYRIVGVNFEANQHGAGDIITLGSHFQAEYAEVPHHMVLDRVIMTGDPAAGQKRAIAANAAHVVIENSDIRDVKAVGQDSQAIAAWNTPGPITIRNNYLEAAGENILFGGAFMHLDGVVPSDIVVEDNYMTKDLAWRGTSWTVKNVFELKNARRVTVRRNVLEYTWSGAQSGYAVLFTPANSSRTQPWVVVEDVAFTGNIVRHAGGAFNIIGYGHQAATRQLRRVVIRDNLVYGIDHRVWGGAGVFAQIGNEPRDIVIDHNTVLHTGNVLSLYSGTYIGEDGEKVEGGPIYGLVFTNNLQRHNAYGIFGSGVGYGNPALDYYAPDAIVRRNAFADDRNLAWRYPVDNFWPTIASFESGFVDLGADDYRLVAGHPYEGAGTNGRDVGADTSLFYEP